jgi:multidrug efflux pump
VFGYSINTLTMLAMVLAIGLLVDDAIVVVENVERVMDQEHLSPLEATRKAMSQITGALIGVALVLAAVFVPMGFFGGSTGVIYRQFSVTIVAAVTLSVLVAMVLTPALCATLLKPTGANHARRATGLFGIFNRWLDRGTTRYERGIQGILGRRRRYMVGYAILVAFVALAFTKIPAGFLPDEDQGLMFAIVQLPPGATQDRTLGALQQVERHLLVNEKEAVESVLSVAGFSFAGGGQNAGMAFVRLRPWDKRHRDDLQVAAVAARASQFFANLQDGTVFAFSPPAVPELGNASGFDLILQDRANLGHGALTQARNQLLGALSKEPALVAVRPNGQEDTPEFRLAIDTHQAGAMGLSLADINDTFSSAWGSVYVNDFIDRGRVKKVFLQSDAPYRMLPEDIGRWYVRNSSDEMVPFSAFATTEWTSGSPRLERYNGVPSMEILGMAKPGSASSGEAMAIVERHAAELPAGIGYEWTGVSLQEREAGSQTLLLYTLAIAIVFLCLAALYESWSIPLAVILVVPLGVLGALIAAILNWKMNDVYFQVGLLTTIGLTCKNAILIVEFAKELHAKGTDLVSAAVSAARMRLRPILMTSLAFVLGALPLLTSTTAGAAARSALGSAVVGGMISGTVLAIFFVPLLFVVVMKLFTRQVRPPAAPALELAATPGQ